MAYNPSEKGLRIEILTPASPTYNLNSWRSIAIETVGSASYTLKRNNLDVVEIRTDADPLLVFSSPDQKNKDLADPLQITCLTGSIKIHYLQNP